MSEAPGQQRSDNVPAWSGQPHKADLSKNSPPMLISATSEALARLRASDLTAAAPCGGHPPDQSRIGGRRGDQRDAPAAYGGVGVDHPIGSQLGALGALRPGLFDRLGNMRLSEVFVADLCQNTGGGSTTQSAVNSMRSARFTLAFSIASAT
jgi:hypothetical protein